MKNHSNALREIRRVLDLEARTLSRVRDAVNGAYARAVKMMAACKGKVIVTGTGKSGLIGQKIAGTLASTGTPALFLHPADALHGDLGTVQRGDLVLAIGKSGESAELNGLLLALKKMGVPVIAMTGNPRSTLARGAALTLAVPVAEEACPLNLAPTCSTTAALAVGDALAVALMKAKKFDRQRFAMLHPGGQLGKRLTLTVADVMYGGKDNPVVRLTAPLSRMLIEITRHHTGAVSVVDAKGRFQGLVTDYDLRKVLERGEDIRSKTIAEIMNPRPTCARPDQLAAEALDLMLNRKKPFAVLPVVDGKRKAVGMVHLHDLRRNGL